MCIVTGWGVLSEVFLEHNKYDAEQFLHGLILKTSFQDGSVSATLQMLRLPILSQDTCIEMYKNQIKNGMFCAGYTEGGKDSCQVRK